MTCIVGIIEKDTLYIGADSAGVFNYEITVRKDPKVFHVGPFLFGVAGSFRVMQILRFSFKPPKQKRAQDVYEYMCTDFINEARKALKEGGVLNIKDEVQEHDAIFLVGYQKRLFIIDADFQVGEHTENWNSVGLGSSYSLGALKILYPLTSINTREKVKLALEAANHYCGGVCPPFNILHQK